MGGRDIETHAWAVLAAVLSGDTDGLHALMQPLDRDELDFLLTSLLSIVAGFVVGIVKQAGHPDPHAEALRMVREQAMETAVRRAGRGDDVA